MLGDKFVYGNNYCVLTSVFVLFVCLCLFCFVVVVAVFFRRA